jgi:NADPH-dependent glutamate synthase beta subunit-like oxidoreductase
LKYPSSIVNIRVRSRLTEDKNQIRSKVAVKRHFLPVKNRINNFKEVNLGYHDIDEVKKECERCFQCFKKSDPEVKPPPCMKFCPTHCNTREIIGSILENKIEEALQIIYEHYPFPRSVERVCPGYCQLHCTAGKRGEPIQIPSIKRFLVDNYDLIEDYYECEPDIGREVAIIGSGPLGLSTAYFLRKNGIGVTIFEKLEVLGGMLVSEIPPFRLPRDVINKEIDNIKKLGIKFETSISIDEEFTIKDLFELGYCVVVIGIGSHKANWLQIPGEDSKPVLHALNFLKNFNLKRGIPDLKNKRVAIIGGGSTATDAARVSLRMGAEASILYRRDKEQMPAGKAEIIESEEEGVTIEFLTVPTEFVCNNDESIGAVCQKVELGEVDSSGRPIPIPIGNAYFKVDADFVMEAIGQEPDLNGLLKENLKLTERKTILVDENFFTSIPEVLAGGDCVSGSKSVVDAVAQGKIIAEQINKLFQS